MKRFWPHLGPRVAGHRWASITRAVNESLGLVASQAETAIFRKGLSEAVVASGDQSERGTFAETRAESVGLTAGQAGSLAGSGGAALAATGSYRSTQPDLFVDALTGTVTQVLSGGFGAYETPPDPAVADPKVGFNWGDMAGSSSLGPSYSHVESANEGKWAWVNAGGDWVNTSGTAQGTTNPHFTFTSPAGTNTVSAIAATAAAQAAALRGKWNAYVVRASSANVSLVTHHHTSLAAPFMSVSYTDGTNATLACTACVPLVSGSTVGRIGSHTAAVNPSAVLQFEMPTKPVSSATVTIVTVNSGSSATVSAYLANPTQNTNSVTGGLAGAFPLDSGISSHPSILFTQRMVDGTTTNDYVLNTADAPNTDQLSLWDPELYGGAANTNVLPTRYNGTLVAGTNKWFHRGDIAYAANVTFVNSSYTSENFVPAFSGIGALKVVVPKATGATGSSVGFGLGTGCSMWALFPKAIAGLVSEDYVRFMFRIAGPAKTIANSKMFRTSVGGTASYDTGSMRVGKWGIGSHHWTRFGGNAQSGGANLGHSNRLGFTYHYADAPLAGVGMRIHSFDMNEGPAAPYKGEDMPIGSIGGMGGAVYHDRWYTIEIRKKLNTYDPVTGNSSNDGIMQVWLDGVLVAEHTGWNFRDGLFSEEPLASQVASQPTLFKPFREMGDFGLSMDHYVGGNHRPDEDFTVFYTMIAAATERIGPVAESLPTWVPPAGDTATYTVGGGVLTNNWRSIHDPTGIGYDPFYSKHVTDYSSTQLHKTWKTHGGRVIWGGGHAGTNYNGVTMLTLGPTTMTFECLQTGTPWTGGVLNTGNNFDQTDAYGEATTGPAGRIGSPHSYGEPEVINGKLTSVYMQAFGTAVNGEASQSFHQMDLNDSTVAPTARMWTRVSNTLGNINPAASPCNMRYVPAQNRIYWMRRGVGAPDVPVWTDMATGAYVTGSGTGWSYAAGDVDSGGLILAEARNLLICAWLNNSTGFLVLQYMNVAAGVAPSAVTATLSQNLAVPSGWGGICWCEDSNRILVFGVTGNTNRVYEITIPSSPANTWTVDSHLLPGGKTIVPPSLSVFSKSFDYNKKTKSIEFLPNRIVDSGNDSVQVYRPRNTYGFPAVLGSGLIADNETEGVNSRTLTISNATADALILSWVGIRTSIFAGPVTGNNSNTHTQQFSQDYGPTFTQYTLRGYRSNNSLGGSNHNVTVTKSSGNTEEMTLAALVLTGGAIVSSSVVNRTAAGAGATHTSGTVTVTGQALLVAVGSGTGDVSATPPTQTWPAGWTIHQSVARGSGAAPNGHVPIYVATKRVDSGTHSVAVKVAINEGIVLSLYAVQ